MKRRGFFKTAAIAGVMIAAGVIGQTARAADTIKVGILHSLSGTMAISETTLKDTALMAIEEINAKGLTIGGQKITLQLDAQDDAADPRTATQVAQKLVDDKVRWTQTTTPYRFSQVRTTSALRLVRRVTTWIG